MKYYFLNFGNKIHRTKAMMSMPPNVGTAHSQTVISNPKTTTVLKITDGQMNRQANASAKSKEVQANTQSQRFCTTFAFAPTARHTDTTNNLNILKKSNITNKI